MEFYTHSDSVPSVPIDSSEGPVSFSLSDLTMGPVKTTPFERRFNPYDFNGGTTIVIAGEDFAISAGCMRMSTGYEIISRNQSKQFELTPSTVLAAVGCMTDVITLNKVLNARLTQYEHSHEKKMSCQAVSQLLGNTLYSRRFFPYYAFCMIAGLDQNGRGAVYGYDAVGSFKRDEYGAMGSGQTTVMPILDNLIGHKNRCDERKPLTLADAIAIVKDCFVVATERDIYTGDAVEIKVIRKEGITTEIFPLRKD